MSRRESRGRRAAGASTLRGDGEVGHALGHGLGVDVGDLGLGRDVVEDHDAEELGLDLLARLLVVEGRALVLALELLRLELALDELHLLVDGRGLERDGRELRDGFDGELRAELVLDLGPDDLEELLEALDGREGREKDGAHHGGVGHCGGLDGGHHERGGLLHAARACELARGMRERRGD